MNLQPFIVHIVPPILLTIAIKYLPVKLITREICLLSGLVSTLIFHGIALFYYKEGNDWLFLSFIFVFGSSVLISFITIDFLNNIERKLKKNSTTKVSSRPV